MKKRFVLFLTLVMTICLLAACGEDTPATPDTTQNQQPDTISGELFDAGNVQVRVPEGWKAFPVMDLFADEPNTTDPDAITICKGGQTDLDLFSKPYIRVDFYGPDLEMMGGLKDFYDQTEDLEPIQLGSHNWQGFTTTDYGLMAVLVSEEGDLQFQVSIYLEASDGKISLEDADVRYILETIAASN